MLPLRLLWRNWRGGGLTILSLAMLLAISVVGGISIFTDRLETSLVRQSHELFGADKIIRSGSERPNHWEQLAFDAGINTALTVSFSSMVFANDEMHLAAVKAVNEHYPLLGELTVADVAFADKSLHQKTSQGPQPGEVWVDARLIPLLDIELGDVIQLGVRELVVTKILVSEPDTGTMPSMLGARVLMNYTDLPSTEVIQPGSRVQYRWMLSANPQELSEFIERLQAELSPLFTVQDIESSGQRLGRTLTIARQFLLLAASIGVLLSGVAIAISARRFSSQHIDQVALLKSLGASKWRVRYLYGMQMLWFGVLVTILGLLLAELLQRIIAYTLSSLIPISLMPGSLSAYGMAAITGMVCLLCFVLPPLWSLQSVPPIKILRREVQIDSLRDSWQLFIGLAAMVFMVALFTKDLVLSSIFLASIVLIVLAVALVSGFLLRILNRYGRSLGHIWRLALANLTRYRFQTYVQVGVFAIAIMLLITLTSIRTSLIRDWQMQLPPEAPNHFLLNIADYQQQAVNQFLTDRQLNNNALYPMVRGRLTHVNGEEPSEALREKAHVFRGESNLSWVDKLQADNEIITGHWWDTWSGQGYGISLEQDLAESMGVTIGDKLRFNLGGFNLDTEVSSIRKLRWDSMNPNFYFLLSPGALEEFSPTYLTSVYLPPEKKTVINDLLKSYPTVVVIELDRVIAEIQTIVSQVSRGVELVLWLVLLGGFLVMWSAVRASFDIRMKEAALLRAMGSTSKRLLRAIGAEFFIIGIIASFIAVVGAQMMIFAIQHSVLEISGDIDWGLLGLGFFLGCSTIVLMGLLACRPVVSTSPVTILRGLE